MTDHDSFQQNGLPANPYAPPIAGAIVEPELSVPQYLTWSRNRVAFAAVICVFISGGCVLAYQMASHIKPPVFPPGMNPVAISSFASVGVVIAFVFGATVWEEQFRQCGIRAAIFSVSLPGALIVWDLCLDKVHQSFGDDDVFYVGSFLIGHLLLPAAVCWIRGVPVRYLRLFGVGFLAFVVWIALSFAAIMLFVRHQSSPTDDYLGFTSLTALWALVGSYSTASMLRPLPE